MKLCENIHKNGMKTLPTAMGKIVLLACVKIIVTL